MRLPEGVHAFTTTCFKGLAQGCGVSSPQAAMYKVENKDNLYYSGSVPRYKEPFSLYPRKTKKGVRVWYYRTYDKNGKRTIGRSTGQIFKTLARRYCQKLIKEGKLIPQVSSIQEFPQPGGDIKVKSFSKIKETDKRHSKLRLCFEFKANEDPLSDLYSVGLVISRGIIGWHREKERDHSGCAYILTDSKEDLEKAQERLCQMGWERISEV